MRDRGRKDIIDALAVHEIDFHSDWHSRHPVHAEYLDEMGWDDGVQRVIEEEAQGIRDVEEILGQRPIAYCKPGGSWGPQVAYGMALMGLPVFCDAPFEFAPGQPMWFCNQLFIGYHASFDRYFEVEDRLTRMKADFRQLCDRIGHGTLVMYTHPVRLFTRKFADNYRYGKNTPRSEWVPAPMRSAAQIEALIRDFDAFVGYVVGEGVEVIDYQQLYEQYEERRKWIDQTPLFQLAEKIQLELNSQIVDGTSYSPAEIFGMVVFALAWHQRTGSLPQAIPIRRLIGPTGSPKFDDSQEPVGVDALLNRIGQVDEGLTEHHRVPSSVVLEPRAISPGSFLKAAAHILGAIAANKELPDQLPLDANWHVPKIVERSDFTEMRFDWSIFYPGFEGKRVIEMAKLQAWTAKPALKGSG
ncbi:MAG: hypothetical protein O7E52_27725 [Candidatus Poribacteria bacterium]|nr:hypothetical protein [Candidatus Poribacteria bacterium]